MATRNPAQDEALRWYVESHGLVPQLSAHPVYYFRSKRGGARLKSTLPTLLPNGERLSREISYL